MDIDHLFSIGLIAESSKLSDAEIHDIHTDQYQSAVLPSLDKLSQQDLLQLASKPVAIGKTARLETGCLAEWASWAKLQPQRLASVQVSNSMCCAEGQLSLVSWNTLSNTWLRLSECDPEYAHVGKEWFEWQHRSQALVEHLSTLAADIFCLQEVDFDVFHDTFLQPLSKLGYDGLMQNSPKRAESQPCGNATFWRRNKFELSWADHRSRTLLTEFKMKFANGSNTLIVINAHLESSQSKFSSRASQVHSALEKAARRDPRASCILTGDFNTGADSSLCQVLREHEWHGFSLASVYEHPVAEGTSPVVDATFRVNGHSYLIDHLWYRHGYLQLRKLLQPLNSDACHESLGHNALGLPDQNVPSDHIPLGAIFELKNPPPSPDNLSQPQTAEELWSSAMNTLRPEQRDLLQQLKIMQHQQKQQTKSMPSREEIDALQALASERKSLECILFAGLDEPGKDFVRKMRALWKNSSL